MLDMNAHLSVAQSLRPQEVNADGTVNGENVDLANYDAAVVVIDAGAWATDGTNTFVVEEADDDGTGAPDTYAAVADADLDGTEPVVDGATDDDQIYTIGYIGGKRWLRVSVVTTANTSGTFQLAASVIRGKGRVVS